MLIDQLRIGNKYSYDDFEASMKERKIGFPSKKTVKHTVPFSNTTYDFTNINGEAYWNERKLEYVFEIDADTPEELEKKKVEFAKWVMNVFEADVYDPFVEEYHFIATFDDISIDDSEIEKATITVSFSAYPFKVANAKRVYESTLPTSTDKKLIVENKSSHKVSPTLIASVPFNFTYGNATYSIKAGTTSSSSFKLDVGVNELIVHPVASGGTLKIEILEEVF